jgi:hypothetical protein
VSYKKQELPFLPASPEDPLTLNREIVLVQMGSDEAVVSTRKRIALNLIITCDFIGVYL